jgi:hypothetical protein
MKQQLDELNQRAMSLIKEFVQKNDPVTISAIAAAANRIRLLSDKLDQIEHEIPQLKETLRQYDNHVKTPITSVPTRPLGLNTHANGYAKSPRKGIRIEVDWSRIGKPKAGKEVINEHMASNGLTKWVTRLYQELGEKVLTTLRSVRVNRGPLLSNDPKSDFKNHADGTLYQHQQILNTGYYVLTHSNTAQKVGDIHKACRVLGFPVGTVVVVEVEK